MLFVQQSFSQGDSATQMTQIRISYAAQFPSGHLKETFGWNSNLSLGAEFKFQSNWAIGIRGSFLFGNKVKKNNILKFFEAENGAAINDQGSGSIIIKQERGISAFLYGEKLFPFLTTNKNSGFVVNIGAGFLAHKIRLDWRDGEVYQLKNDLDKGYDRLSMGFATTGFIGYTYLSKSRLLNFFGGFTYTVGFTHNMRGFNYDTRSYDNALHTDILYGFRVGWILPLYKRSSDEYYYH